MNVADYQFAPQERPTFPGSPFSPAHTTARRVVYACAGVLISCSSTFTNALVNVNVGNLAGSLGLTLVQASILPAVYIAMSATANLTLVRARQQFGIPQVTLALLSLYAIAAFAQLMLPTQVTAIITRATCGLAAASLQTLAIYYLVQVLPPALRPIGLIIGISLPQLGTPLARLIPIEVLATNHWSGLSLIELGVALAIAAILMAAPLPPSERSKAFELLDLLTIGLIVPGFMLLSIVLVEGRLLWWSDTPWLGWFLAISVPLIALAVAIEHNRARPLIHIRWLGSIHILRFVGVALFVRLALAEQTYGSVGFLTSGGLTNDQLHALFWRIALAMVLGAAVACATLSERRLPYQILAASLIVALGAYLDSGSTSISRPEQLYWSQSLIAFGTTLFIGPTFAYGFIRMLQKGASHLVSLIVIFSVSQNVGGLAGSAILGTYQAISAKAHAATLAERIIAADPLVAGRIQASVAVMSNTQGDPVLRGAQGAGLLGRALANEANTLAFNDVFRLVMWLALGTAVYLAYLLVFYAVRSRRQAMVTA